MVHPGRERAPDQAHAGGRGGGYCQAPLDAEGAYRRKTATFGANFRGVLRGWLCSHSGRGGEGVRGGGSEAGLGVVDAEIRAHKPTRPFMRVYS